NVEQARGEHTRAATLYEEALALRRELGHRYGIAVSLGNLGHARVAQGRVEVARDHLREGLWLFQELDDARGMLECLSGLASVAFAEGDAARAASLLGTVTAQRKVRGIVAPPDLRASEDALACAAHDQLGPAGAERLRNAGSTVSLSEAVAAAMGGS